MGLITKKPWLIKYGIIDCEVRSGFYSEDNTLVFGIYVEMLDLVCRFIGRRGIVRVYFANLIYLNIFKLISMS